MYSQPLKTDVTTDKILPNLHINGMSHNQICKSPLNSETTLEHTAYRFSIDVITEWLYKNHSSSSPSRDQISNFTITRPICGLAQNCSKFEYKHTNCIFITSIKRENICDICTLDQMKKIFDPCLCWKMPWLSLSHRKQYGSAYLINNNSNPHPWQACDCHSH